MNHYFDKDGFYTFSAPSNPGTLPPINATRKQPPECGEYEWPRWLDDDWFVWESMKGATYYTKDGVAHVIMTHTDMNPPGTLLKPPPNLSYTHHDGETWLQDIHHTRRVAINVAVELIHNYVASPLIIDDCSWSCDPQSIEEMRCLLRSGINGEIAWPIDNGTDLRVVDIRFFERLLELYDKRVVSVYKQFTAWKTSCDCITIFVIEPFDYEETDIGERDGCS